MKHVIVVGGGIAGLSTAVFLARRGVRVTVLERAPTFASFSTAASAGIFRLAVEEGVNLALALRSRELFEELGAPVEPTGGLYPCTEATAARMLTVARDLASRETGIREAHAAELPDFICTADGPVIHSPHDGRVDVAGLVGALLRQASGLGVELRTNAQVHSLEFAAGRVTGVNVGEEGIAAEVVVDAAGAFSPTLFRSEGDVGIRPHRRHVFVLEAPAGLHLDTLVWDLVENVYVRPDGSGEILACPCDQEPLAAVDPVPEAEAAEGWLRQKLATWAPPLAEARVLRKWAGIRPLTVDHRFVVGWDPTHPGLFRVGGFGGHGITAGIAAGELAARLLSGERPAFADELEPSRFRA